MTIGERIKELREQQGMTQDELAIRVGYRHKTSVNKIETGERKLMQDKILAFADALGVSPYVIMGWDEEDNTPMALTDLEIDHMKKYRAIDTRGRDMVDVLLDQEYKRAMTGEYSYERYDDYLYLGKIAAAGTAIYPGDIPLERIRERHLDGADFMVGVCGDSMEPAYFDGDKVYVKKTTDINFGDVGLFIVNGYYYIKEYAPDGLRSHNPNYSLIPKSREIIVVGKVLGKAEK